MLVRVDGQEVEVPADLVVVAAGAYGSPAVLLRSGLGPGRGAGRRIHRGHGASCPVLGGTSSTTRNWTVWMRPSAALLKATAAHYAADPARAQSMIRASSRHCAPDRFDHHILIGVEESEPDEPPFASGERLA